MGDLEKVFVGTMMLTGMLILFLFGLYFDLGDIVAGTFGGHAPSFGQDLGQIRRARSGSFLDEEAAPKAKLPTVSSGTPRVARTIDYQRFVVPRPPIPPAVLFDREMRRLQRKGFVDEQYMRMKAIYEVDRSVVATLDRFDRHMDSEDYEGAIQALLEALEHLDPANHLARRDLVRHLYQAYILAGKDAEATKALSQLTTLHEKVVAIEERAELHQDSRSQEYNRQMREQMGKVREAIQIVEADPIAQREIWTMGRKIQKGEAMDIDPSLSTALKAKLLAMPEVDDKVRKMMLEKLPGTNPDQFKPD
jgi:hypothetical protein